MSTINFNKYIKNNQVLDLSDKWGIFCNSGYEERVKDLGEFIKNNPNITTLNLSNSYIKVDSLHSLVDSINNSNITTLDISDNNLGPEGAEAISKMKLTSLNISDNNLGPKGAEAISKMKLNSLNISGNDIGPEGAKYIPQIPNLNSLDISANGLGPKEVEGVGKLTNCSLEGDGPEKVFCSLVQQKNRDPNITPEEIQNDVFALVRRRNDEWVEYILNNDYPVLINSPNLHGTSIGHFYPDSPVIQQLLFHKGLIPAPVLQRGSIGNVTADREGVHLREVVDPINFTVAELIEFYGQDEKQVSAAVKSFQNKLAGFNPNSLKVSLLSLTESGKKNYYENRARSESAAT